MNGERIEKSLNECVMGGMKNDARPDAAGSEAHPGPEKTGERDDNRDHGKVKQDGRGRVVVAE